MLRSPNNEPIHRAKHYNNGYRNLFCYRYFNYRLSYQVYGWPEKREEKEYTMGVNGNKPPASPTVKFRVDPEEIKDIREYAKAKGFRTAGNLARVALFYYMNKNKLKK